MTLYVTKHLPETDAVVWQKTKFQHTVFELLQQLSEAMASGLKAAAVQQEMTVPQLLEDVIAREAAYALERAENMAGEEKEAYLTKMAAVDHLGHFLNLVAPATAELDSKLAKQREWLEWFNASGRVRMACEYSGVTASTVYHWANTDLAFLKELNDARREFHLKPYTRVGRKRGGPVLTVKAAATDSLG